MHFLKRIQWDNIWKLILVKLWLHPERRASFIIIISFLIGHGAEQCICTVRKASACRVSWLEPWSNTDADSKKNAYFLRPLLQLTTKTEVLGERVNKQMDLKTCSWIHLEISCFVYWRCDPCPICWSDPRFNFLCRRENTRDFRETRHEFPVFVFRFGDDSDVNWFVAICEAAIRVFRKMMGTREGKWNFNNSRTKHGIFPVRKLNQTRQTEMREQPFANQLCCDMLHWPPLGFAGIVLNFKQSQEFDKIRGTVFKWRASMFLRNAIKCRSESTWLMWPTKWFTFAFYFRPLGRLVCSGTKACKRK